MLESTLFHRHIRERKNGQVSMETEQVAAVIAEWLGIEVPEACRAGVARNLAILTRHMAVVSEAARDAPTDPAELLRP